MAIPKKGIDITGKIFGRLTVIDYVETNKHGSCMWKCSCTCGNTTVVSSNSLRKGNTTSCGCFAKEQSSKFNTGRIVSNSKAILSPTIKDIYWAAGIYEGEGNCRNTSGSQVATVTQKDSWILYKFRDLFGGKVYNHPTRNISYWTISGVRARGFLMTLFSILSPCRQQQIIKILKRGSTYGN